MESITDSSTLQYARALDEKDSLREFRKEFFFPKDKIYFQSHQLGLLSKRTKVAVEKIMLNWE